MKPAPVVALAALLFVCLGFGLYAKAAVAVDDTPFPPFTSLIEAERAFAKMSVEKTTREAFLAFLADESLLFAPGPVPGKMFYRNAPDRPTKLSWAPEFADVSQSGDLGYTSGPWELHKDSMSNPPTAFGHFNSIWRVQKDGSWKVEVDLGTSHGKPDTAVADVKKVETLTTMEIAPAPKDTKTKEQWQTELLETDRALAKQAAGEGGVIKAFESAAADKIRVFRDGNFPAVGKAAALKLLASSGTDMWQPTLARVSVAGDLGYSSGVIKMESATQPPTPQQPPKPTVGSMPPAAGAPHYYIRIWRRDKAGVWKIVLDVTTA